MHSTAPPPTKAERARLVAIYAVGCVPCRLEAARRERPEWKAFRETQIQHVLDGGRRAGHADSYGACPWHHEGIPDTNREGQLRPAAEMVRRIGPSRKLHPEAYRARYGTEAELVAIQNEMLRAAGFTEAAKA